MAKSRRRFVIIVLSGAAGGLLVVGGWRVSKSPTFQLAGEIVPRVNTSIKAVALTFDDGPTPEATDRILSILREKGVKATFFLMGAELELHPESGKKIAADGHELGNHSYSHTRMVLKTPAFIREEIERTDRLIRDTGYSGPIHFRPPFGKKLFLLPLYLAQNHRLTITWDVAPDSDPEIAADAVKITQHALEHARPGSIILLHIMYGSRNQSLLAVGSIVDGLKAIGFEFRTISELLSAH
jgi:peptidoglycan/xylan/chitin deacetylase (PgdA/CDA1 family)